MYTAPPVTPVLLIHTHDTNDTEPVAAEPSTRTAEDAQFWKTTLVTVTPPELRQVEPRSA